MADPTTKISDSDRVKAVIAALVKGERERDFYTDPVFHNRVTQIARHAVAMMDVVDDGAFLAAMRRHPSSQE